MTIRQALSTGFILSLSLWSCRGTDDDTINGSHGDGSILRNEAGKPLEGGTSGAVTIYDIMDRTVPRKVPEGQSVTLKDVIVTAVATKGSSAGNVWVQESKGGAKSGLLLYKPQLISGSDVSELKLGDHVKVEGVVKDYAPADKFKNGRPLREYVIELDKGAQITRISEGTPLPPQVVEVKDLLEDPGAAQWEHVLVTVRNVTVMTNIHPTYAEFNVTGGLSVDDGIYLHSIAIEDCLTITGISNYFYEYKLLPRSAADFQQGADCPKPTVVKISDIQNEQSSKHPPKDTWVKVTGAISAIDSTLSGGESPQFVGFWIQEKEGGPYSGIYVYYSWDKDTVEASKPVLSQDITLYGTYVEYKSSSSNGEAISELQDITWIVNGQADAAATVVQPKDIATGGSEVKKYEGVLVKVVDVKVGGYSESGGKQYGITLEGSNLRVEKDLYDFMSPAPPAIGTPYGSITGPLHYSYDNYKILPRSESDLVAK